jgi:uncharacterized membrane protein HdeD (DUF308 family)
MLELITSRWWIFLVRGIAAIIFGLAAAMWPQITLPALAILFGAYALIDGVFALAAATSPLSGSRWFALLIEGLLGLTVAFFVFTQPALSAVALVYAIAFWSIFTGILEIVAGVQLRDLLTNEWLYILAGVFSIAFGVLVVRDPGAGALAIVWLVGFYAILFGVAQIALSLRLRQVYHNVHQAQAA